MSDVYVKWMKLKGKSGNFKSYSDSLNRIAEQVNTVRERLRLSDDVSYSIKSCLSKDVTKLRELSVKMGRYSSALGTISDLYKTTEENNINR